MSNQTEKEIFALADELFAKHGQKPTNDEVLAARGRGSLSTISPIMRKWRERERSNLDVSPAIREIAMQYANAIWKESKKEAVQQFLDLQKQLDREKENNARARETIELLKKTFDTINNEKENYNIVVNELTEELTFEKNMHNRLKGEQSIKDELIKNLELQLKQKQEMINALINKLN